MSLFSPEALQRYAQQLAAQDPTVSAEPAHAEDRRVGAAPYVVMAAGNLADGASTWYALTHGYGPEGNPLYPNNGPGVFAIRAAELVPQMLLMRELAKHGHPRLAKLFGYGMGAWGAGLAAHNLSLGPEQ